MLNICGWADGCAAGNSVCSAQTPTTVYGTKSNSTFVMEHTDVKLVLGDGDACDAGGDGSKYTTIVLFECDENESGEAGPTFLGVSTRTSA